jgi:NAD(P)-dependent dehydrogenase (short-subunit alcohol dehydrogenase family)
VRTETAAGARPLALVVGLGPGLSAAIVRRFADAGFVTVGVSRNVDAHVALARELAARGQELEPRAIDAGDFAAVRALVADLERQRGPVEVLVYNAYRSTPGLPSTVHPEDLLDDFRVNVAGALAATQAVLPGMRARGRGTVLLTGGGLALDPTGWPGAASLAVGKAGLRNLAQALHADLKPAGITVATVTIAGMIAPGTPFDPATIAETYWRLATAGDGAPAEILWKGGAA